VGGFQKNYNQSMTVVIIMTSKTFLGLWKLGIGGYAFLLAFGMPRPLNLIFHIMGAWTMGIGLNKILTVVDERG